MYPSDMLEIVMNSSFLHGFYRFTHSRVFRVNETLNATENAVVSISHETHLMVLLNQWLALENFSKTLEISLTK